MVADAEDGAPPASLAQLFPDCREDGETTLRQCQLVMIRMLKILDHICQAEGISYWLTAGTLIGALRHRGIIPWDCDIDIAMTEEDHQELRKVAGLLPRDIFFQNRDTDPYYDGIVEAKLRDRHSNYYEWQIKNPDSACHNGLQVDIFLYRRDEAGRFVNPVRGTPYERSEIFPLERAAFEGSMLSVPRNPGDYINRRYGDYTKPPPPEQRFAHEGKADPFNPCDHLESLPFLRRKAAGADSGYAGNALSD